MIWPDPGWIWPSSECVERAEPGRAGMTAERSRAAGGPKARPALRSGAVIPALPGGANGTHGDVPNPGGECPIDPDPSGAYAQQPRFYDPLDLVGFGVFGGADLERFDRIGALLL